MDGITGRLRRRHRIAMLEHNQAPRRGTRLRRPKGLMISVMIAIAKANTRRPRITDSRHGTAWRNALIEQTRAAGRINTERFIEYHV